MEKKHSLSKTVILSLFILFPTLFLPSIVLCQTAYPENEKMHFGVTIGGACNTTFPYGNTPWTFEAPVTKIGVSGGAYFEYDFSKRFFAHLELNISGRRLLGHGSCADTAFGNYDIDYHYTNITTPIGIGFSIFPHKNSFNASILACVIAGMPQHNESEISIAQQNIDHVINPIGVGGMVELRLRYEFIFLSFRYELMGTPVFKYQEQAFRTGTFSFFLGFQIF